MVKLMKAKPWEFKRCPIQGCGAIGTKMNVDDEGGREWCNHITCTACKGHWCWHCKWI